MMGAEKKTPVRKSIIKEKVIDHLKSKDEYVDTKSVSVAIDHSLGQCRDILRSLVSDGEVLHKKVKFNIVNIFISHNTNNSKKKIGYKDVWKWKGQ